MAELPDSPPLSRTRAAALRLLSDDRLARLSADGDREAFATIYERYHQALYRYCFSLVHHSDDALDALHNTMLNAMRGMEGRPGEIALKPWLYRIAHNESVSLVRRRPAVDELDPEAAGTHAGVEHDAAGRARLRQLVEDVQELPERQRGALVMRELNGLSHADIAAWLGVSTDAAKQSVLEARRALVEFREGRDMDCDTVCRAVSDRDRRVLRARKLRSHLRACTGCREFEAAIRARRADFAAVCPQLPASAAAAVLHGLIGGGGGTGGGLLAGLLGGGGAGSAAGKSLAVAAATAVAGAGALGLGGSIGPLAPDGRDGEAEAAETDPESRSQDAAASAAKRRSADVGDDRARRRGGERSRARARREQASESRARKAQARRSHSADETGAGTGPASSGDDEIEDSREAPEPEDSGGGSSGEGSEPERERYESQAEGPSGSEEIQYEGDGENYESNTERPSGSEELQHESNGEEEH